MKVLMYLVVFISVFSFTAFTNEKQPEVYRDCISVNGINLDFVLTNMTGYDIENIYVAPTTERNWGEDIMGKELLLNEESVEVSFDPGETATKWDIYVTWKGYEADEDVYWIGLDLSTISEITLHYEEATGKTWAITK